MALGVDSVKDHWFVFYWHNRIKWNSEISTTVEYLQTIKG